MDDSANRGWAGLGVFAGSVSGMGTGGSPSRRARAARLVRGGGGFVSPILREA